MDDFMDYKEEVWMNTSVRRGGAKGKKRRDNVRGPWIIVRSCLESMPSKSGMSIQQYPSHPF